MSENLSPLSNSTSALLESWIWSEQAWLFWSQNCGLMEIPKHAYFYNQHSHRLVLMSFHTCYLSLPFSRDCKSSMKVKTTLLLVKLASVTVTRMHSSRMCTACTLPYRGSPLPPGQRPPTLSGTDTPLPPGQRPPLDRGPLWQIPPGQRPPREQNDTQV